MESSNDILLVTEPITTDDLERISQKRFGDMVKIVVDIQKGVMAIGAELHADEEQLLLDNGSSQQDLWGINVYHELPREEWIEFDSMINIRPSQGNRSRSVEDKEMQKRIVKIVDRLITA